jgi:hypothetical protein
MEETIGTSMAESEQPKTSEELQELFQMKKKILLRDHDINKVTRRLKQIQQQEVEDAREISRIKGNPQNIRLVKAKIMDLKKDIRKKEDMIESEQQKIQNVLNIILQ